MKNCKGSVQFILFINLILISSLILITTALISTQLIRSNYQSLCVDEIKTLQHHLQQPTKALLALNPAIRLIRLRKKWLQFKLAQATLAGQLPAIAALTLQIKQQDALLFEIDVTQKKLKNHYLFVAKKHTYRLSYDFFNSLTEHKLNWAGLFNFIYDLKIVKIPQLGLVPDSTDIAPIYELSPSQEYDHSLIVNLQTHFTNLFLKDTQSLQQNYLDVCSGTSIFKEGKWKLIIHAGKF